ncbi:helix-turn-helix transcriptional regulator [Rhizobium wenxiniae]|uniref:helix-turn-helix transcriptional regulator n=1 Tax=Rhizobium wenxiniae TaxID=1737357 RepID=UPI003C2BF80E
MAYALMRIDSVCAVTGLSRSEIYRRVQAGTFPKQTRISHRYSAWKSHEIADWIRQAMGDKP